MTGDISWETTASLREHVARMLSTFPDTNTFLNTFVERFDALCTEKNCPCPSKPICRPFVEAAATLYKAENLNTPPAAFSPALTGTMEGARYRDDLLALHRKAERPDLTLDAMHWTLINSFLGLIQHLPSIVFQQDDVGTNGIALSDIINVPQAITDITLPFLNDGLKTVGIFSAVRAQLLKNQLDASNNNPKKLIDPHDFEGSAHETIHAYLKGTPLEAIFSVELSFVIPESTRFEHTQILGGSGAGKTTLIQQIILDDLARPDPPAMVIIDPKGLLVERVQKLDVFDPRNGRLKDRLVIVDPTQSPPPALNMFHPATKWDRIYSDAVRRQIENQAVSNFAYIFSSVGSKLTDKQSVPFTFLVRLLFTIPDATILTLLQLLDDPAPTLRQSSFAPHIACLDAISQGFFENEYYDRNFGNTRKEIKARLYSILMRPEFVDMFSAPERKLDMFNCLQSRKIVLVNTSMNALGRESSALLGRYMIALALNAAFERSAVPREKWSPAFLIIDEFQEFADEQKTPELLRLAREYNLGVVIAHQQMHSAEFSDDLRNAISTNTSTKYAAAVEAKDLSYVARDLRCEDDFLQSQKRTATHAHFACFIRNFTDHAVSISVPLGNIGPDQQMSEAGHQEVLRRNALMLTARLPNSPSAPPRPDSSPRRSSAAPETSPISQPPSDTPEAGSTW